MPTKENIQKYKDLVHMFEIVIERYPNGERVEVYKAKLHMLNMFLKDLGELKIKK